MPNLQRSNLSGQLSFNPIAVKSDMRAADIVAKLLPLRPHFSLD